MKWKVLASKYLAKDAPWFTVRVEKVELPNGEILENYYILEYPHWACVIAITVDHKIVMVEQYRHGIGEVGIELPAGVIDEEDSSPLVGASRELLEETGYGGGDWELFMTTSANPGTHTNLSYTYLATNVEFKKEPELDRTEDLNVKLFTIDELKTMLDNNEIIQAMHAAPLWKFISENT